MTEREMIINILNRLQLEIYYQDDSGIAFENGGGYEALQIEFNENGNVTDIYC